MKFSFTLTIILFITHLSFGQNACHLSNSPGAIVIQGKDNKNTFQIKNFNCVGCSVKIYYNDTIQTITYQVSNIIVSNEHKILIDQSHELQKNLATDIIQNSTIECAKPLVADKINKGNYKLIEDSNSITLTIQKVSDDDLQKYHLKIIFSLRNGIKRVKEFGRYYFLDSLESAIKLENGEPERYDTALDFQNGSAIVGFKSPSFIYYIINSKGQKSQFSFTEFEENFGGNSNLIKIKDKDKYYLISRDLQILKQSDSDFLALYDGFFTIRSSLKDASYDLVGIYQYDNGVIKEVFPPKFNFVKRFGCNFLYVEYGRWSSTYGLLDEKSKFQAIPFDFELSIIDSNNTMTKFSNDKTVNNIGIIFNHARKVLLPKFHWVSNLNIFGLLKTYVGQSDYSALYGSYSYINTNGDNIIGPSEFLSDFDSMGYVRSGSYPIINELSSANKQIGYLDIHNSIKVPFKYYELSLYDENGLAWGHIDNKIELINRQGNNILACPIFNYDYFSIDSIPPFSKTNTTVFNIRDQYAVNHTYVIAKSGKVLVKNSINIFDVFESEVPNTCFITDHKKQSFYFNDNKKYPDSTDYITRKFKNGYAFGSSEKGGSFILDSAFKRYPASPFCFPFDSLSDVIGGKYVIATKNGKMGIIQIYTGEKYVDIMLDNIAFVNDHFICSLGNASFSLLVNPANKIFPFYNGDEKLYKRIVLNSE